MLVKCAFNKIDRLSVGADVRRQLQDSYRLPEGTLHLTVGEIYVVYAALIRSTCPLFFVADDDFPALGYPVPYEAVFFEIADDRLSRHWRFRCSAEGKCGSNGRTDSVLMSFPEWVQDDGFYERLLNGDNRATMDFRRQKSLMDMEFPNPLVTTAAVSSEGDWVICPKCSDGWESSSLDGLIRCPSCSSLLLNPRFSDDAPAR